MNNSKIRLEFKGSCSEQDKVTFAPDSVVNLFIVFELDTWSSDFSGSVKLTKNADRDKYKYTGY